MPTREESIETVLEKFRHDNATHDQQYTLEEYKLHLGSLPNFNNETSIPFICKCGKSDTKKKAADTCRWGGHIVKHARRQSVLWALHPPIRICRSQRETS